MKRYLMNIIRILGEKLRTAALLTRRRFSSLPKRTRLAVLSAVVMGFIGVISVTALGHDAEPETTARGAGKVAAAQTTRKMLNISEQIPYTSATVDDPNLAQGTRQVRTNGVDGIRVRTFDVTYENGKEVSRKFVSELIIQQPVQEVIAQGVKRNWEPREPYDWDEPRCEKKRGRFFCFEE